MEEEFNRLVKRINKGWKYLQEHEEVSDEIIMKWQELVKQASLLACQLRKHGHRISENEWQNGIKLD